MIARCGDLHTGPLVARESIQLLDSAALHRVFELLPQRGPTPPRLNTDWTVDFAALRGFRRSGA